MADLVVIYNRNGNLIPISPISSVWINLITCTLSFPGDNSANVEDCGILYNWYAAVDPRGLCPVGWELRT